MADDPEARRQIARLLMDERLRDAAPDTIHQAVDDGFERLTEGILAEATASDDVIDGESALVFIQARIDFLGTLLSDEQKQRLHEAVEELVASW